MMSSHQRGKSLEDYSYEINKYLSLIVNQIKTSDKITHPEAVKASIETYNEKALDAFMRGLNGDLLGQFLKNYRPESLAQAYAYCTGFQNVEFRKKMTKTKLQDAPQGPRNLIPNLFNKMPPKLPPKPQINRYFDPYRNNFPQQFRQPPPIPYRQPQQIPFRQPQAIGQPPAIPFRPQQRNPFRQDKPEPMEVDASIRSRQVNYGNRPNSNQHLPPQKRQRVFFTQREPDEDVETTKEIEPQDSFDDDEGMNFERYLGEYSTQEQEMEDYETAELNFLG